MCARERYTARRGRAFEPRTFSRTRSWRRIRPTSRLFSAIPAPLSGLRADLAGLTRLAADALLGVLDALRLVRVRHAQRADLRGHLADELLVDARDLELLGRLGLEGDALRRVDLHRVREAERELELLARDDRAVAGARDLEVARVAGRDAGHHVRDERARETVQRARRLLVVLARDDQRSVLARDVHVGVDRAHELALRPLHAQHPAVDRDIDALRHLHRQTTDPTHS